MYSFKDTIPIISSIRNRTNYSFGRITTFSPISTNQPYFACWIGDFLTQFYYYLYAGSIILTVSLLLLMGTLYAALRKTGQKKGWAFAIAVVLTTLEAICHLRYDFGLSSTYAATGAALLFCHTPRKNFWIAILTPLAYWLFGYGAWLYLLFTAIRSWKWALPSGIVTAVMVYMLKGAFLLTTGQAL